MAHDLQVLDIEVVVQAEADSLLFRLVRRLAQKRMRRELLDRIDFGGVRIRNARRQHVASTREAPYFGHPNTVEFGIGGKAVVVVVRELTVFVMLGVKAHVALAVLRGIVRVNPARPGPVAGKARARRQVDYVKDRARIVERVRARITHILRGRILVECGIGSAPRIVVKAVVEVIIELLQVRLDGSILRGDIVLVVLEREQGAALPVLHVGNLTFQVVRPQVMALARLHGKALVSPELSGICHVGVRLLVQDGLGIESVILTHAAVAHEGTRTAQRMLSIGSQVLVVREADIVTAVRHVEFLEVARVTHVTVEYVALFVPHLARERRPFKPSLLAFDNVALHCRIPVVVGRVVKTEVADIVPLHLVATELRCQEPRLSPTLERGDNHREHRHRHIGNVQYHGARRDGLLGFHHHAAAIEIEMLVRRIVTGTKVTTCNLESRIGQAAYLHAVQLLVVLVGGRVIDFANAALHVVLETHSRKRRVLGLAQHGFATRHQHLVLLVKENGVGIQRGRPVLELGTVVKVESRRFHVVHEVHRMVLNRVCPGRIVHPVDFGGVLFHLFPFFEFKAGHLLAMDGRNRQDR